MEARDKRQIAARHREHLIDAIEDHGPMAVKLEVEALEGDIGALPAQLRAVMSATKEWIASKSYDFSRLRDVYAAAEARKGSRARLPLTPDGRSRRLEWASDERVLAEPLHYRWQQVKTLLNDLANCE